MYRKHNTPNLIAPAAATHREHIVHRRFGLTGVSICSGAFASGDLI
jgi:hypothetical protein